MGMTRVSITFQTSLLREIDQIARAESRSRSELLREAARVYIRRKQRRASVFAMGLDIAAAKGLSSEDVSKEIQTYRKAKASRR